MSERAALSPEPFGKCSGQDTVGESLQISTARGCLNGCGTKIKKIRNNLLEVFCEMLRAFDTFSSPDEKKFYRKLTKEQDSRSSWLNLSAFVLIT